MDHDTIGRIGMMAQSQQEAPCGSTRVWTHPSRQPPRRGTTGPQLPVGNRELHHQPRLRRRPRQEPLVLDTTTVQSPPSRSFHPYHDDNNDDRLHPQSHSIHRPPPPQQSSSSLRVMTTMTSPPLSLPMMPSSTCSTTTMMKVLPFQSGTVAPSQRGFLYKLGVRIPIYKRRFFVLTSSSLYYYLSPHDTEPRGCYHLQDALLEYDFAVHENDDDDDTGDDTTTESNRTFRFAIVWKNPHETDDPDSATRRGPNTTTPSSDEPQQRVDLEARTQTEAQQWIRAIQNARLSTFAQQRLTLQQSTIQSQTEQLRLLQEQLDDQYRYMEQERNDAIQDATACRQELQSYQHQVASFSRQIRQGGALAPRVLPPNRNTDDATEPDTTNAPKDGNGHEVDATTEHPLQQQQPPDPNSNQDITDDSKLHVVVEAAPSDEHLLELYHLVKELQEEVRSITSHANIATQQATTLDAQIQTLHHRNEQMEQHLCQIWEENCTLRKSLKLVKQEKRILVREIKLLRDRSGGHVPAAHGTTGSSPPVSQNTFTEDFLNAGDEEKLIQELEEHVLSSIRLHEAYLSSVPMTTTTATTTLDDSAFVDTSGDDTEADRSSVDHMATPTLHPNVPLFEQEQQPTVPIVSLFDNDDDDDDDEEDDVGPNRENADYRNRGATDRDELETDITTPTTNTTSKKVTTEDSIDDDWKDRPNPLLRLDDDNHMESENVQSSNMSEQNRPTYQLSCPLTDAISATSAGTNTVSSSSTSATQRQVSSNATIDSEASQVYHITFYSRKIGIQFQKVPPTPIKAKGLLTEVMRDDLTTSTTGTTNGTAGTSNTTAAELRRIAAISMSSKGNHSNTKSSQQPDICDVATPVDAVLVCGFHGFNESNRTTNNCPRPKLGARLVAFDGVSIEIGRWTFTAVRKAIQSCGRPLTLSFRNDYLTKEQRTILTKAVLDVDMASSSYRPNTESLRGPIVMKQSSLRDPDVDLKAVPTVMTDDMSESAGGDSDYLTSFPQSFSGNRSVNSLAQYRSFYETRSYSSSSVGDNNNNSKHKKIRSFSEAGGSATTTTTSSSVLSAIGPLVSNLLYRPRRPSEPFTPEYLRRAPEFVEETPQHQDFQSELL